MLFFVFWVICIRILCRSIFMIDKMFREHQKRTHAHTFSLLRKEWLWERGKELISNHLNADCNIGLRSNNNRSNVKHRLLSPDFGLYFEFPMNLNHMQTQCHRFWKKINKHGLIFTKHTPTRNNRRMFLWTFRSEFFFGWMIFARTRTHSFTSES